MRISRPIASAVAAAAAVALATPAQAETLPLSEQFSVDCRPTPDQPQVCGAGHWNFFGNPPELVHVRYTASPQHCSDINASVSYENAQTRVVRLKPGASTAVLVFHRNHYPGDKDYPVDQGVFVTAQGIPGGCNTGSLSAFGGTVEIW